MAESPPLIKMFQSIIQNTKILCSLSSGFGALSKKLIEIQKPLAATFNSEIILNPNPWKYKRLSKRKHNGRLRQEKTRNIDDNNVRVFCYVSPELTLVLYYFFHRPNLSKIGLNMMGLVDTNPAIMVIQSI